MALLDELEGLIDELLTLSESLRQTSNALLCDKTPIAPLLSISLMLGARARSALRATRALTRAGTDDQIAILARSQAEATIDMFYLRTPTIRTIRPSAMAPSRAVELSSELKAELFLTYYAVAEQRLRNQIAPDRTTMLNRARELRRSIPEMRNTYWHGSSTTGVLEELKAAAKRVPHLDRLEDTHHLWRLLSLYAHTNPMERPYFGIVNGVPQLVDVFYESLLILSALLSAAECIVLWAEDLGVPIYQEALSIIKRAMALHGAPE